MEADSARWTLWAYDYFDRDSERSLEAEGTGLRSGLEALWSHVLEEGILDDGRPTFTWFDLEADDTTPSKIENQKSKMSFSIPRNPLQNPELGRMRGWRTESALIQAIARAHLDCHESGGTDSILSIAKSTTLAAQFLHALKTR